VDTEIHQELSLNI